MTYGFERLFSDSSSTPAIKVGGNCREPQPITRVVVQVIKMLLMPISGSIGTFNSLAERRGWCRRLDVVLRGQPRSPPQGH